MFGNRRDRGRAHQLGLLLLMHELLAGAPVPPITLAAVLFQIAVFLEAIPVLSHRLTRSLCLLPARIVGRKEWLRLFASLVMHADDMHLYYNMVSFMWKGRRLEPLLGRVRYLVTLLVLSVFSSLFAVAISVFLDRSDFFPDENFSNQCAVGFSGVIFALKVLSNHYTPEDQWLMGWFPIPSKYACWAELILIQVLTPNASFVGHLAGIVAGLAYTTGPLLYLVNAVTAILETAVGLRPTMPAPSAPRFEGEPRSWGEDAQRMNSDRDIFHNYTGGVSEEEQVRRALEESLRQRNNRPPSYGWNIPQ